MNFLSVLFLVIFFLFPYIGFMTIIAVVATKAKWKPAQQIRSNINLGKVKNDPKLNKSLSIYIFVSISILATLLCGTATVVISYLNPPAIYKWINFETLQIVSVGSLLFGAIAGAVLWILWSFLEKKFVGK